MNNEYNILKSKLETIIKNNRKTEEFKAILKELNGLKNDSVSLTNNSFFSRIITSIRAKFVKPNEKEFDDEKYEEIKRKAIKIYCEKVLKNDFPATIEPGYDNGDAHFENSYANTPQANLFKEIRKYAIAQTRLKELTNGDIEIYPWKVEKEKLSKIADSEYLKISERLLTTDSDINKAFEESLSNFSNKNKTIENRFLKSNIVPYYGSPEFIAERSEYILECMERIISEKEVKEEHKEKTKEIINEAKFVLNKIENCKERINIRNDDRTYDEMKKHFEKLLSFENIISEDVEKIWNEFLTKPEDYKEGERFAFLAHTYTKGVVGADKMNKCCCTLVTDKCMPIPYGNMGIICGYNKANISTMCTGDAGSWVIDKKRLLERGIPVGWQFAEAAGDSDNRVFYEYSKISKLILPTTMEKEMIENNLSFRGKFEGANNYRGYTEVFMVKGENGEKIPIQELFFTDEQGREKANKVKGNHNPLFIDPSKGTEVPFYDEENKSKPIGKIKEEDK